MKIKYVWIQLILIFSSFDIFSQKSYSKYDGIWEFIPISGSNDTTFKTYSFFRSNKSLEIFYWKNSKIADTYGTPFSYYGFWDTSYYGGENQPKHITELKPNGKFIFFYDDLIHDLSEDDKIGYDSLGNLYRPTRKCDWGFTDDGNGIEFNFGPEPDVYKRVEKVPDYVLLSLKQNKEHWKKYLDFIEHKELIIRVEKSRIFSTPDQLTKMYLIKGDEVEVVEEKEQWLRIRYYGNGATSRKVIEGWIKKTDVE